MSSNSLVLKVQDIGSKQHFSLVFVLNLRIDILDGLGNFNSFLSTMYRKQLMLKLLLYSYFYSREYLSNNYLILYESIM
jgi:hypothetical protein